MSRGVLVLAALLLASPFNISTSVRAASDRSVLTLAWEAEPRTLDPRFAIDANSQYLEDLLHCSLITYDHDSQLKPALAEEWQWTTPTTLSLKIRPHVNFADGKPVTASDVAATYRYFKAPGTAAPRKGAFKNLKSVGVSGNERVIMELQTPDASFIANLGVGILPAAQAHGPMLTEKDQVFGCGPFVLKSATPQAIELTANNFYSFVPPPKLARVIIKIVKDENTRFAKLIAGELDMVQNLISRDKLTIIGRDHPELTILRRPGLNTVYLGFNMRTPALSNKLVRQAITHAIDKDKIIHYVLKDMAVPADTLLPTADPFHAADLPVLNYDPRRASDLLDQAGFKPDSNGQRFTLSYKTTTDQTRVVVAKAIAAELRRVGIAVHIETLEWGRFKADVDHGRVEMWGLSWVGFKDPDIYRFAFSTTGFPPDGGNRGWFSSTAVDKLLEAGAEQTDTSKRSAIYADAQRLLAGEAPYVFLWHEDVFAVVGRHVEGFEVYADGRLHSLTNTFKN